MHAQKYNVKSGNEAEPSGWIPVTSQWVGSWRVSIDRRAHNVVELTDRYDEEAESWQRTLARLGVARSYRSLAAMLSKRLESNVAQSPVRVLDCGAGTATLSIALAKSCSREIRISAVDISPGMIQQARKAFNEAGLSVDLERADVRKLPHASNTQDVVIAAHVLEHLADPSVALAEMYRVLKPGGLIVLCCTRRSLSGRWIQMKWRTHTVTQSMLFQWLSQQGFIQIAPLLIDNKSQLHKLSLAVTARKTEMVSAAA